MEESTSKLNFREDLLVRWHTQFAENQRIREQSFLKLLGFLGAVVLGYAIVYKNEPEELNMVVIAAISLIFFGAWQILTIAYNFRRDQYVNTQIRKDANVCDDIIFPKDFDPSYSIMNSKRIFSWIPDFLLPYYVVFPFFQILLLISYFIKIISTGDYFCISFCLTINIVVFIILLTVLLPYLYFRKLVGKLKGFEERKKKRLKIIG